MCLWPEDANSDDGDSDMGQFESYEVLWNSSALINSLESRKRTKIEGVKQPLSNIHESPGQSHHGEPGMMTRSESSWRRDRGSIARIESQMSTASSQGGKNSKSLKARISMFPQFLDKLDLLKGNAQDMMDAESDSTQQDIIAQQFAEASLILLRQLRYHCMNSGLDGWRQGKSRRKILVVDDSMVTRKLVARAFEKANFIVDTAQNGEEGVAMMKKSIYDIAFMDIDMPVMNGFDATKALREWENLSRPGARQPICALTAAYVDDFEISELMKFKEAGLDVMESKPCNIPRLFKVVDDVSPMFSDLSISVTQHL
jgi:CheY-like chemotaxis protein